MEDKEQTITLDKKEEEQINSNKEDIEIENKEDESNKLLSQDDNNNQIEINTNNTEQKQENNIEAITNTNTNNNINSNIIENPEENTEKKDENLIIGDYLITIQYTKFLQLPYFKFGNIFNFYCPCYKFKSNQVYLSQMPTPPFGIIMTDCKKKIFLFIFNYSL